MCQEWGYAPGINEKVLTAKGTGQFLSPKSTVKLDKIDDVLGFSQWLILARVSTTWKNFTQFSASEPLLTQGEERT